MQSPGSEGSWSPGFDSPRWQGLVRKDRERSGGFPPTTPTPDRPVLLQQDVAQPASASAEEGPEILVGRVGSGQLSNEGQLLLEPRSRLCEISFRLSVRRDSLEQHRHVAPVVGIQWVAQPKPARDLERLVETRARGVRGAERRMGIGQADEADGDVSAELGVAGLCRRQET